MAFKVGDVVQLKSGGPKMTIVGRREHYGDYQTSWFAGSKNEHGYFPEEALMPVKEDVKK